MLRVASADGVELAVHDLTGPLPGREDDRAALLLVHATGFCAGVHRTLATALAPRFRCYGVDMRGHGHSSSPTGGEATWGWDRLAADVAVAARAVGDLAGSRSPPPYAFGHSSGGAALLAAEASGEATFTALWCYEPIVWPDPAAAAHRATRLAEGALRRRRSFPSAGAARANFAAKTPFASFDAECLRDYVRCGFAEAEDGSVSLRCAPESEAAIYRAGVVGDRFTPLSGVRAPAIVAHGAGSGSVGAALAGRIAGQMDRGAVRAFGGLGHFGPMESPSQVAEALLADLAGLSGLAG